MWMETEGGIWAKADAAVFRLLGDGNRTERRLLAAGRTIDFARRRVTALRRMLQASDAKAHAAAEKAIEREFAPSWGKTLKIRVRRNKLSGQQEKRARRAALQSTASTRSIRTYQNPLVDGRGRIALYFRVRYVGLKSKKWRPGLAVDHAIYILREEALEGGDRALEAAMVPLSNMGDTVEEIAAGWRAIEAMEEGYRSNAKVQYRIIWNLPHHLNTAERREIVEEFCERTFSRLGLPWAAAIHHADQRGDQRNYHAHIVFSTRPCEHVGDHEWIIAQEKVNGLTDENGLKQMRALAAGHMNIVCRAAGLAVRFTHQSYKERGIDAERQEHVGSAAMAAHERGEKVAVIERNALIAERNERAIERDATARLVEAATRVTTLTMKRVDLVAVRRKADVARIKAVELTSRAGKIVASLTRGPRQVEATVAAQLGRRAAMIGETLAAVRAARKGRPDVLFRASEVLSRARIIAGAAQTSKAHRSQIDATHEKLIAVKQRLQNHLNMADADRREAGRALILNSEQRPYQVDGKRIVIDLSGMRDHERALVRELDNETKLVALRERRRRDLEHDAAKKRTKQREERERQEDIRRIDLSAESQALHHAAAARTTPVPPARADVPERGPTTITNRALADRPNDTLNTENSFGSVRQHELAFAASYRKALMNGWSKSRRLDTFSSGGTEPMEQSKNDAQLNSASWRAVLDPRDRGR
jgi:hypothetical protein